MNTSAGRYIVVGIDRSDQSAAALRWAADYVRTIDAPLRAVFVQAQALRTMPYAVGVSGIPLSDPVDWESAAWAAAQELFRSIGPEPDWTVIQVGHGNVGPELVASSRDAMLLVVGKGEHTGWDRLVEGSVSHYCLSHAEVPVVGVPAERVDAENRRSRISTRTRG